MNTSLFTPRYCETLTKDRQPGRRQTLKGALQSTLEGVHTRQFLLDWKYFRHHGCLLQITFRSISQLKYGSWSQEQCCTSSLWSDHHKREREDFLFVWTLAFFCLTKAALTLQVTHI